MDYKVEENYSKLAVLLRVMEESGLSEVERDTLILIAQDYMEKLGYVIGIEKNTQW